MRSFLRSKWSPTYGVILKLSSVWVHAHDGALGDVLVLLAPVQVGWRAEADVELVVRTQLHTDTVLTDGIWRVTK